MVARAPSLGALAPAAQRLKKSFLLLFLQKKEELFLTSLAPQTAPFPHTEETHLQQQQIQPRRLILRDAFAQLLRCADQIRAQAAVGDGVFLDFQLAFQLCAA